MASSMLFAFIVVVFSALFWVAVLMAPPSFAIWSWHANHYIPFLSLFLFHSMDPHPPVTVSTFGRRKKDL